MRHDLMLTKMSRINFFKRIIFWVDVTGDSMSPVLKNGKSYLASNLLKPQVGKIIVFKNPSKFTQVMVKKIISETREGYEVAGLKAGSTSSKEIGYIKKENIIGTLFKN